MVTVRFPDGFSVQYNDLSHVSYGNEDGYVYLHGSKADGSRKEGWSVRVPREAMIEFVPPCATYDANKRNADLEVEVAGLRKDIRALTRKVAKS